MLIVLKSGSLNLLQPAGPVQACNGIDFYVHIYLNAYIWMYGHSYLHTYIHIYIHLSSTYERICIFTDLVTCPTEPSKTQGRKVPHTTGKYTTQYLLLAQKIKISSKLAKTQQHQRGPHSHACMNETINLNLSPKPD